MRASAFQDKKSKAIRRQVQHEELLKLKLMEANDKEKLSSARAAGIVKGIMVDQIVNKKEKPWLHALSELPMNARKRVTMLQKMNPGDYTTDVSEAYREKIHAKAKAHHKKVSDAKRAERAKQDAIASVTANMSKIKKKRAAITAARERAAAAAQQPKRRRRRADDDVIAAAGVGFNRTRSGREH